jgi:hypothetical protein
VPSGSGSGRDEPARQRASGGEGDLLAEHGADRELAAVDGPRHAKARAASDQRGENGVATEVRARRGSGLGRTQDRGGLRIGETDHARAGDGAAIDPVDHLLDTGDRACRKEGDEMGRGSPGREERGRGAPGREERGRGAQARG